VLVHHAFVAFAVLLITKITASTGGVRMCMTWI
jgi:hypothetical protein